VQRTNHPGLPGCQRSYMGIGRQRRWTCQALHTSPTASVAGIAPHAEIDICLCASRRVTIVYFPRPAIVGGHRSVRRQIPDRIVAKKTCSYAVCRPDEGHACNFTPSIDFYRIWAEYGQTICWPIEGLTGGAVIRPPLSVGKSESTPTMHTRGNLSN